MASLEFMFVEGLTEMISSKLFRSSLVVLAAAAASASFAQNITESIVRSGSSISKSLINHKGQNTAADADGDGISDAREIQLGTNPGAVDTDGDGLTDGVELAYGSDPNAANLGAQIFYQVTKLPTPTNYHTAEAADISHSGIVAGYARGSSDLYTVVRWTLGTPIVTEVAASSVDLYAQAVNESGVIVGSYDNTHALRWAPGEAPQLLSRGPSHTYYAWDVNSAGVVVGDENIQAPEDTGGFIWTGPGMAAANFGHLTIPPGYRYCVAYGINDRGQVVGEVYSSTGSALAVWNNAGVTPTLINDGFYGESISEDGYLFGRKGSDLVIRSSAGEYSVVSPGNYAGYPIKINANHEAIGVVAGAQLLWRPNAAGGWDEVNLRTRILDSTVAGSFYVYGLNDKGQIAGGYRDPADNRYHAVVLTPALLQPSLAVDANRDGVIKLVGEDSSDGTSAIRPYHFWLNNDIDRGHTVDGDDYEQDDISPTEALTNNWVEDWKSNTVPFRRDLEDFARIVVFTSGLSDAFRNGDLYLGLKWTDTVGTPSIKLYKQYDATGGTSYLTDDYQASVQLAENAILNQRYPRDDVASPSAHTVVTPGDVFVFPQALWFGLSGDALKRSLLFEGCTAGTGQLKLVILKREGTNYTEIGDGPGVWLNLRNIKDMYEHWTVGQGPVPFGGGAPGALSQASSFTYTAQSLEESKYILFVHGWNMEQWEKERFAETAYKRLYWQGYKGRFGLFSWPTTNGFGGIRSAITDGTNYDRGEFSAWRSASLLEQKLAQLNGQYPSQVHLLAHSMGNVVAGEALRRAGQDGLGVIVRTYVASQAALPVQCYNGSLSDNLDADVPASGIVRAFDGGWPQTANAYKSWLAANSAAVAKRVNFFNINDYALWRDIWQLNQWLKPDRPDLRANPPDPQRTYAYLDNISQPPTQDGFGWLRPSGQVDPSDRPSPYVSGWWYAILKIGNAADVKDRYEIMAMASESRSKALGATSVNEGLDASLWLGSIWPADPSGDARPYSRHKWHSAQFRSSNMLQKGYWQALLGPQGFNIVTPP